ncbi:MAG: hypothetical protein F6K48_02255 [Okeania sp. SIO3H1]|uniref:hypothetical protein n=1 Tax=Okeania sp. SIO1I7 TaxID=2607772 RepID=UPI0013CD3830|nr:hypothetical protein [Okeania sp. SIO1I7]NEN87802.1 hypothetical protein [Okeania sp. SIO3H1]NET26958.1 hypothetical protein [Okeania sp. SIO1I7]
MSREQLANLSKCWHLYPRSPRRERRMGMPINLALLQTMGTCVGDRRKGTPTKKAAGLAVSAPVAHGGDPQDRAGLSVERL